jgi:hypothetical protein
MTEESLRRDAQKLLDELKYNFGEPIVFEGEDIKDLAKYIIDFHVSNFKEWAISQCCAEDFGYEYWEKLKETIDKI